MQIGDIVTHNTFPPIQGAVAMIQPSLGYTPSKIGVMRFDTKTLFWDYENTWIVQGNIQDYMSNYPSSENQEIVGETVQKEAFLEESDIIDAEFREV